MTLYRHCKLVEVHDEMAEQMNTGVVVDDTSNDQNFELDMADNNPEKEWGPEDFVPNEETEDAPWDREDKAFANSKLTNILDVREVIEPTKPDRRFSFFTTGLALV